MRYTHSLKMHAPVEGEGKGMSVCAEATIFGLCSIFQSHGHYKTCDVSHLSHHHLPANAQYRLVPSLHGFEHG